MSSLRYKSFCLGIVVTSITWAVILYLYTSLNESNNKTEIPTRATEKSWKMNINKANTKKKFAFDQSVQNEFGNSDKVKVLRIEKDFYYKNDKQNDINRTFKKKAISINKEKSEGLINAGPISVDDLGLVKSIHDQQTREEGYHRHAFNLLVSNRLDYHRSIPDTRNPLCKDQVYPLTLPSASIIICFYNEAKSTLLRTIYSVLDRTPDILLHEILLIDDFSDLMESKIEIEDYIKTTFSNKVKLFKTSQREGLIRARMFGAHHATGEVLVFLDSHCEVNQLWLEPLLSRIAMNHTQVVCPIIDIINADTFAYTASPIVRGGFNWGLHFKWDSLPANALETKADFIKPILSPTMAGGLFAINRNYFRELGEYDEGMDVWGGENLEISFRIWMCGGSLEIIPCSRVGHVFRRRRPYGSLNGEDTMVHNSLRVAHVWMDEYKDYYFKTRPDVKGRNFGNITERLNLRKKLNCKSFDWYLKNIYPELKPPVAKNYKDKLRSLDKREMSKSMVFKSWKHRMQKLVAKYQIRFSGSKLCIESEKDLTTKGSLLVLRNCAHSKSQIWFETEKQELLLAELLCLDAGDNYPHLAKCHEMGGSQEWKHKTKTNSQLYNMAAGMCLGVKNAQYGEYIIMEMCTLPEPSKWDLLEVGSFKS